ncbi:MAG: SMC-Scp complex subunit ScpB [Acidobacteriaceae bacterium]
MSLKAKIEAVIYASEEPVTLAQLTGLLGQEGQAELDAIAAQQHTLALQQADEADADATEPNPTLDPDTPDADALNAEVLEDAEPATESGAPGPASVTPELPSTEPVEANEPEAPKPSEANQKEAARKLRDYFRSLLDQLIADYANGDRGLEIREVAGGFRLATKPEYHDAVRGFVKSLKPPLKLSLQALETLAVVAYKQPVTAPEVSEIRGVDSAGVLGSLLTRKLVTTAGRKQVIGRPILYKTTKDFLLRFGLKDINELPSIEEFEKMAGELNETLLDQPLEPEAQEEIHMEHPEAEPGNEAPTPGDGASSDPAELEGHNLQPIQHSEPTEDTEPDVPTSEPESISEAGEEPPQEPGSEPTPDAPPEPEA